MKKLALFIAAIQGLTTFGGRRVAMVPKIHLPSKEEKKQHATKNPTFKRRRKETTKRKQKR